MEFSTPPLPMSHIVPAGTAGTLRRGVRGLVPPPDVTHHTNHSKHDMHQQSPALNNGSCLNGSGGGGTTPTPPHIMNNLNGGGGGGCMSHGSITPKPPMQGILKDPNRKLQNNMQILNVQNAPGIGNNLLMTAGGGAFDPSSHNLSSFNASMGYTDADGHLV